MAIAYRASGAFVDANSTTTGSIGLPAGLANGDILVLVCQNRGASATVATPSGYTVAGTVRQTAGHQLTVFYRHVANAGAEVAPAVVQSVSGAIRARLSAFSGCSTTTPLDVAAVTDRSPNATTFAAPSIVPVSQAAMVVWCYGTEDDNALATNTQGTLAYSSDGTAGNDGSLALVYELQTNAAASGTCSLTQAANGPDNWTTITIALRPAAVAASNPSRDIGFDSLLYIVEAAFGAGPFTPDPTWTDISAHVRADAGISIQRGRSSEFSDTQSGTMSLTLNNRGRLFDPDYSAGTWFGQLVPQVRIRLRCRFSSTNYPMFDGYVTGWPQSYLYPREAVVQLDVVDLFGRLNTRRLPPTLLALEIMTDRPVVYFPMLEDALPVCADISGNGWAAKYAEVVEVVDSFLEGERGQKAKRVVEDGRNENQVLAATGPDVDIAQTVEVWFKVDALNQTAATSLGNVDTLAYGISSTNNFVSIVAGTVLVDAAVEFLVTVTLLDATGATASTITAPFSLGATYQLVAGLDSSFTTWSVYLNGALVGSTTVSAFTFDSGTVFDTGINVTTDDLCDLTVSHLAVFDTPVLSRVATHLHAGTTGGYLDLAATRLQSIADFAGLVDAGLYTGTDMGTNTFLGSDPPSGNVLSAMQDIIRTEQGRLFVSSAGVLTAQGRTADMGELAVNSTSQATISDSGVYAYAEVPIDSALLDLMRNAIYVSTTGATVQVSDSDSVAVYDELEESMSAILDDPTAATNLGLSRLRRFSTPTSRINQVKLIPHGAADVRYPLCLGVELGWRLTVTRTPQALGSAISKVVTVEGITHTFTESHLETTLYLVPAQTTYTTGPLLRFGDATFGQIGAADANALVY